MAQKAHKVFIDGSAGTTGLQIAERLEARPDIELLSIGDAERKDIGARLERMLAAEVTILCLPDDGAREIVEAVDREIRRDGADSPFVGVRIIDCSTAHRVAPGWTYGMAELGPAHAHTKDSAPMGNPAPAYAGNPILAHVGNLAPAPAGHAGSLALANRVSNPGCHATGFILAVRPLVDAGLIAADAQMAFHSLTGYSGGGKKMIAAYEGAGNRAPGGLCAAPRQYGLAQTHKHLPEMVQYAGLSAPPIFAPIVGAFDRGMLVSVPIPAGGGAKPGLTPENVHAVLAERYAGCPLVKVRRPDHDPEQGFLSACAMRGRDDLEILVAGQGARPAAGEDAGAARICVISRFDNLGKGASGAAIQNMNRMLGVAETAGLVLGD